MSLIYDKIAIMLPTYKRSTTYLPEFLRSALNTVSDPKNLHFFLCVNQHDKDTQMFLSEYDFRGAEMTMIIENLPAPHLAKYFNQLYSAVRLLTEDPAMVVTMLGDDMVFETPGWDGLILDEINKYGGTGVFWCNDAYIARERCAVNLFVTQQFVEATERQFMCEEFEAEMIDTLWTAVGKYTKTSHFLPDVVIRHNHSTAKPRDFRDETFQRLNDIQNQVHKRGGKKRAKEIAREIAEVLKGKGLIGDSVC